MKVSLAPGICIVAVSGGVDSVVLLDILQEQKDLKLIIAHLDHGIRKDSSEDLKLVEELASKYGLKFESARVELGESASEQTAREARYKFLRELKERYHGKAIVTAHHQDDLLETVVMNLLRGTSWRGLAPMQSHADIVRPLLNTTKAELVAYAKQNNLNWNEDSTNQDTKYFRNYVRQIIMPMLEDKKAKLLELIYDTQELVSQIDENLQMIEVDLFINSRLDKQQFVKLPHKVCLAVLQRWFEENDIVDIDKKMLEVAVIALKTLKPNKKFSLDKQHHLLICDDLSVTIVFS